MPVETDEVYSERYVVFLDILGFSDIVRRSMTSPAQAKELIDILEHIANAGKQFGDQNDLQQDDFRAQSFSDCIVLSENVSPVGLFHLLASTMLLSFNLLQKGIFARGGVAKGKLHHSEKVVFGPAMLEAYRLESTIARYPRILVDRSVHLDCKSPEFVALQGTVTAYPQLKFDHDGPPFLDVLCIVRNVMLTPMIESEVADCRNAIQTALDASVYEPKHYEQLRGLTIYWNSVAMEKGAAVVEFPQLADLGNKADSKN
jgi:hypothetical protein